MTLASAPTSRRAANYEFYISQVEGLFLAPSLLDLDEYGLPLPLALRFSAMGMLRGQDTAEVLESFVTLAQDESIRSNLSEVELWIVDDVLDGLGMPNRPIATDERA